MALVLSDQNVFEYLIANGLCTQDEQASSKIEPKTAKNFNLLLSLPEERKLLVKQEPYKRNGETAGEFLREWRIQAFLQQFPSLDYLRSWLPEIVHFDAENSIIVFNYLDNYRDLSEFYAKESVFPTAIASSIGAILATIHRSTLDRQDYQNFFSQNETDVSVNQASGITRELERIEPEIFGQVPAEGLKFFALYQRYDSLGKAIAELSNAFEPCCLMHNDLKLNNILLPNDWEQSSNSIVSLKLIDWERSIWGDPAYDLGSLLASYLGMWLGSLVVSKSIELEEALRMAMTPLESLQPSMAALTRTYFAYFPEILERRPDFLRRVVQFSGLGLIQIIQSMIQYEKSFGNTG
ncbi:MAG: phosphotransferase family protein, partial [Microcystaceae cyanobacterium]